MTDSQRFIEGLKQNDINILKTVPKADLHNHYPLGGNKEFIHKQTGKLINPVNGKLLSMGDMHKWVNENIGDTLQGKEGRILALDACFQQAAEDNIAVLDIGEDVWAKDAIFGGNLHEMIKLFYKSRETYAPRTKLSFQIGLSRHCSIKSLLKWSEEFFEEDCFNSIDLYADEFAQPIENFKPLYRKAKEKKLILKAHVGEWGTADDVMRAVEELELDEVQHGIAAAQSHRVMNFLADHKIRLNICPTSNVKLSRVDSLKNHPIRKLYDNGVIVTINSDDALVFGNSVSQEFLDLYSCGLFTAEELDEIRLNGLK
ncbi:amidohydrolase family protein [Alkaliphilus hydrothermalis]|uniref:Adenosine deaminase n=1 Tax=Alkaliphilus hydrothermalis TaxID=1482730 RepID=A0ABS2NU25_9FIRM|nr:adenosine deaminase [Alkaliphilus hydrothermalis]MBM7616421.1 adenosine deaminase [Alkaliphilus hydrothermalis]